MMVEYLLETPQEHELSLSEQDELSSSRSERVEVSFLLAS